MGVILVILAFVYNIRPIMRLCEGDLSWDTHPCFRLELQDVRVLYTISQFQTLVDGTMAIGYF